MSANDNQIKKQILNIIVEARKKIASNIVINGKQFSRGKYFTLKVYEDYDCWHISDSCQFAFSTLLSSGLY